MTMIRMEILSRITALVYVQCCAVFPRELFIRVWQRSDASNFVCFAWRLQRWASELISLGFDEWREMVFCLCPNLIVGADATFRILPPVYLLQEYLNRFKGLILTCNGLGISNLSGIVLHCCDSIDSVMANFTQIDWQSDGSPRLSSLVTYVCRKSAILQVDYTHQMILWAWGGQHIKCLRRHISTASDQPERIEGGKEYPTDWVTFLTMWC